MIATSCDFSKKRFQRPITSFPFQKINKTISNDNNPKDNKDNNDLQNKYNELLQKYRNLEKKQKNENEKADIILNDDAQDNEEDPEKI